MKKNQKNNNQPTRYSVDQLRSTEFLHNLKQEVSHLAETGLGGETRPGWLKYKGMLIEGVLQSHAGMSELDESTRHNYLNLVTDIKLLTLHLYHYDEAVDILETHAVRAFKKNFEPVRRVEMLVYSVPMPITKRDAFVKRIKKALEGSQELLGDQDLMGGKKPSLQNWLIDYNQVVGAGMKYNEDIREYIFNSQNGSKLGQDDRDTLKKILEFYERTKRPITDPNSLVIYSLTEYGIDSVDKTGLLERFIPFGENAQAEEGVSLDVVEKARAEKVDAASTKSTPVEPPASSKSQPSSPPTSPEPQPRPEPEPQTINSIADISTNLDLEYLRAQDPDPHRAAEIIKQKLFKLVGASPEDKSRAKLNWQQSPLYKLYITMGQESMKTKKPIKDVATALRQQNKPHLSEAEFKAVVEISRMF